MSDDFPSELELFIAQQIESLAQLEALILMHQDPDRQWDCEELSRNLYITSDMCGGIVSDLERRGFVQRNSDSEARFRYHAASPELDRLVSDLAALYQQRRVAVITQIYSKPVKKVQTFADAFRLRKEE